MLQFFSKNLFYRKYIYYLFLLYFCIGFALNVPENGDEGFFLRVISALIDGRVFLKDFATNQPVITMYLFYPIQYFSNNYFISSRILVGILQFVSIGTILHFIFKCWENMWG